jgi:hypothetical protein
MGSKGMLKILEAVIAILIIFTVFITYYGANDSMPDFQTINWQLKAYKALDSLENTNDLRNYVLANNSLAIENKLKTLMPSDANYQVMICDVSCGKPNVVTEKMISINYMIAGDINNFQPRQIVVYMW